MKKRGVYIEIERLKKVITRIVELQIRQEIIIILNDYKFKEGPVNIIGEAEEEEEEKDFKKDKKQEGGKVEGTEAFKVKVNLSTVMKNEREVENDREEVEKGRIQRGSIMVVNQSQMKEEAISFTN